MSEPRKIWVIEPEPDGARTTRPATSAAAGRRALHTVTAGKRGAGLRPRPASRSSGWRRRSLIVLAAGMLFPAGGYACLGRKRRCARAWALLVPAFLATGAFGIGWWRWPFTASTPLSLELAWLAAGALAGLGGLAWLVLALDGLRLARPPRRHVRSVYPVLLLAAGAAALITARPATLAGEAHHLAVRGASGHLRIVPALLETTAMHLDPGEPAHVWHAAASWENLGAVERAERLRLDLRDRWSRWETQWPDRETTSLTNPGASTVSVFPRSTHGDGALVGSATHRLHPHRP